MPRYNGGTFHTLLSILHYEGVEGLYAGLRPTLLMSVPNTVLYFTVYDEISLLMRRHLVYNRSNRISDDYNATNRINDNNRIQEKSQPYIALIAGSTARLLASLCTAPLELIRTRQAGITTNNTTTTSPSILQELSTLKTKGLSSLYVGLAPTLWRDVPFSAIYWMCLERCKDELSSLDLGKWGGVYYKQKNERIPPSVEAMHAFVSGAVSGSIAAAFTTPFDVVKTRRQMAEQDVKCNTTSLVGKEHNIGILGHMRQILEQEGVVGLWKGNTTRMVKVAPACAIMISVYEFGKRAFGEVI